MTSQPSPPREVVDPHLADDPTTVDPALHKIGVRPGLRQYFAQIWDRREFLKTVPLSNLRAQNQTTVLGNLWHLLNPLFLAGVFFLVFGVIMGGRGGIENFTAFLVIGIFTFYYTRKSMQGGATSITSNMSLIHSMSFPRALLPMTAVITHLFSQFPAILTMLAIVLVTGESVQVTWLMIPVLLALQTMFNLGLTFATARMTFHFADTAQIIPYLLRIWLYLSGVFYEAETLISDPVKLRLFQLNPGYVFIKLHRDVIMDGVVSVNFLLEATVWSVVLLVLGFFFFYARETEYGRV